MEISNDDETVLKAVFSKYDTKSTGFLSLQQFILLVTRLAKYVPELHGIEFSTAQSSFALFDRDADKHLSLKEFKDWWRSKDKYTFFEGEKAILLRKAYALYKEYTGENSAMNLYEFSQMMETLGITYKETDFDLLDRNEDGLISFDEFCKWLNWF